MKLNYDEIKILTAEKGWMMKELSKASGISEPTFRSIRDGRSVIPSTAGKIAKGLGVSVRDILED